ncbi:hypothetical protein KFL_013340010, partial [Klebsormidium nitens]
MIKDLFLEKSTERINEFNSFRMQTNESMSSLTQRMKTLRRPEGMAAQKLLDAIEPKECQSEVRRVVWAEDTGDDDLTVEQISKVATRLEKKRCTESALEFGLLAEHTQVRGTRLRRKVGWPPKGRWQPPMPQLWLVRLHRQELRVTTATQKGDIAPVVQANATAAPQRGGSAKVENECNECGEVGHWVPGPPPEPAADNIYDPVNPQIGALPGKLPGKLLGAYHRDPI